MDDLSSNDVNPRNNMDFISVGPFDTDRFASNTSIDCKRQMVTRSQHGTIKPNPKYALISLDDYLNEPRNLKKSFTTSLQGQLSTLI